MSFKKTIQKIAVISCAVLFTLAAVSGVIYILKPTAMAEQSATRNTQTTQTSLTTQTSENVDENYIGEAEAKAIALEHAQIKEADVSYIFCKLDYDDGVAEYEVEFWNNLSEYDYEINAISGEIIGYDYDMENYDSKLETTPSENITDEYIGEAEAKAIAFAHAQIKEADVSYIFCKLDYDDGVAEYEVEFWNNLSEYDYEINAISGEIIGYDYDMENYDSKLETTPSENITDEYIGEAEAKAIAFAHAQINETEAGFIKCEFDFDDGYPEYEIEWKIGRMEYEYTISATDGTIWEHDAEYDD